MATSATLVPLPVVPLGTLSVPPAVLLPPTASTTMPVPPPPLSLDVMAAFNMVKQAHDERGQAMGLAIAMQEEKRGLVARCAVLGAELNKARQENQALREGLSAADVHIEDLESQIRQLGHWPVAPFASTVARNMASHVAGHMVGHKRPRVDPSPGREHQRPETPEFQPTSPPYEATASPATRETAKTPTPATPGRAAAVYVTPGSSAVTHASVPALAPAVTT